MSTPCCSLLTAVFIFRRSLVYNGCELWPGLLFNHGADGLFAVQATWRRLPPASRSPPSCSDVSLRRALQFPASQTFHIAVAAA